MQYSQQHRVQIGRAAAGGRSRPRLTTGLRCWPGVCVVLSLLMSGCDSAPNTRPDRMTGDARYGAPDNAPGNAPRELLDENSGSTLIVVRRPIVLARSRTDVAANVRDYVTLVATQQDNSGKYSTWLIVHRWLTVDPRIDSARSLASGRLQLLADGRTLALAPLEPPPAFASRGDLLYAPHTPSSFWVYQVDLPTLRYLAAARNLSLRFVDDAYPVAYSLWEDG